MPSSLLAPLRYLAERGFFLKKTARRGVLRGEYGLLFFEKNGSSWRAAWGVRFAFFLKKTARREVLRGEYGLLFLKKLLVVAWCVGSTVCFF
jgi:hypothetical protein